MKGEYDIRVDDKTHSDVKNSISHFTTTYKYVGLTVDVDKRFQTTEEPHKSAKLVDYYCLYFHGNATTEKIEINLKYIEDFYIEKNRKNSEKVLNDICIRPQILSGYKAINDLKVYYLYFIVK